MSRVTQMKILDILGLTPVTVSSILFILLGIYWLLPTSFFITVKSINVQPVSYIGVSNSPISMIVDREIHIPFKADWNVDLQKYDTVNNRWVDYCSGKGTSRYENDSLLPIDLSVDWWMNNQTCKSQLLPIGKYRLRTTWDIEGPFFYKRTLQVTSNVFLILSPE
jgi:hypothetical protein